MEPIDENVDLDSFRDDDEHSAAWKLISDVDDRLESLYPTNDWVNITARSRKSLTVGSALD
jgi:hypothetical protein